LKPKSLTLLYDVAAACELFREFTSDLNRQKWLDEIKTRLAVERSFDTIGSALKRLSHHEPTLAERVPGLADIVSFRNFLTHEYDAIDPEIVWSVIKNDLPKLQVTIQKLIAETE